MMNDTKLTLNLPLDEPRSAEIAYDYSSNRADGKVVNSNFVRGREGNCIEFTGEGYCEISRNAIDLTRDFTLSAWLKPTAFPDGFTGKQITFMVCWDAVGGYIETPIALSTDTWGHIAVAKKGLRMHLYLDANLVETIALPAQPTGFSFLQDIYSTDNGYGYVDNVRAYDVALTADEIAGNRYPAAHLSYRLNGKDLKDWDIYVSESSGLLDRPKLKAPQTVGWDDYHGEVVDLRDKRVEPREITLNCFMKASGKIDFVMKLNDFLDTLGRDGTHRLEVDIHPTKPLLYEVYNESGVSVSKRWNDDLMVGTFTLKLKEPDPVKRIIRHQSTGDATKMLSITLSSRKTLTIHWGDGTRTEDVYGYNVTLRHFYPADGIYHAIVAGVIEDITYFYTNGIIVWNRL